MCLAHVIVPQGDDGVAEGAIKVLGGEGGSLLMGGVCAARGKLL